MMFSEEYSKLFAEKKALKEEKRQIGKLYHRLDTFTLEKNYEKKKSTKEEIAKARIEYKKNKKSFLASRADHLKNLKQDKAKNKDEMVATRRLGTVWDKFYGLKEWTKYRFKEQPMLVGRDIVIILSVLNLALSLAYIQAIGQISNSMSGLLMFGFILFGLISIFNTLRLKEALSNKFYFVVTILILAAVLGFSLGIVCLSGMRVGLKNSLIQKGGLQAIIIAAGYVIGTVFIFIARHKEKVAHREYY